MDMKRILQALDNASTKPVEGAKDMSKFLSIVDSASKTETLTEGANPHKVSLPVQMAMNHYQAQTKPIVTEKSNIRTGLRKYFKEVELEVQEQKEEKQQLLRQYASTIAERVMMKESKVIAPPATDLVVGDRVVADLRKEKNYPGGHKFRSGLVTRVGQKGVHIRPDDSEEHEWHPYKIVKKIGESEGEPSGVPHLTRELLTHIVQQVGTEGAHAIVKSLEWGDGASKELLHLIVKDLEADISENEIPGHSMGFTGGVGPGLQSNEPVEETPIELDVQNPMASTIHSHKGANPGSIEYRIMRARRQLADLANQAQSNDPLTWQHISRLFPELQMNIEQVAHGLEQLAKERRKGGVRSKNIPKHLD